MSSQEMYYSEACGAYNGVKLEQRESAKPSDFSKNTNGNLTTHPLLAHDLLLREDSLLEDPYSHRLDKDLSTRQKPKLLKRLFPDTLQLPRKPQHSGLESYALTLEYMLIQQLQKNRSLEQHYKARFNSLSGLLVQSGVALSAIQEVLQGPDTFDFIPQQNLLFKESLKSGKLLRKYFLSLGPLDRVIHPSSLLTESPELENQIMLEILEETEEKGAAHGYLEFLKTKILDLPVPTHLQTTFSNFKEKYEIVKQREVKRKILLTETAQEQPASQQENKAQIGEQAATSKTTENLAKTLKGKKSLQMPLKRSSSKQAGLMLRKPFLSKESGSMREGSSSIQQRKRSEIKKNGTPSEKKSRGRKKQPPVPSAAHLPFEKPKDANSYKLAGSQGEQRIISPLMLHSDPLYLQQYGASVLTNSVMSQFGAAPMLDTQYSLASPGNGNSLQLPGPANPMMYLPEQKYYEQARMLGKRPSSSLDLDPHLKQDP